MKWPSWWPWLPPGRGDVVAIIFAMLLAVGLAAVFIVGPRYGKNWSPAGFGADWRCFYLPRSEPVCVKKN